MLFRPQTGTLWNIYAEEITDDLQAIPAAELVLIDEFKALIKRAKGTRGTKGDYRGDKKLRASRELAYIWHNLSHDSPYANYHFEIREERVRKDVFNDSPEWEPDELIDAAMAKYKELTNTPAVEMLNAGVRAAQKLTKFLDEVDLMTTDKHGKAVHSAKDLVTNLGNLGKVIDGLNKLREQVENETVGDDKNRRSVETNQFSE